MSAGLVDYSRYLEAGKRVRVALPLADGKAFQEWAVVASLNGDLLDLDLSRDFLPVQARIAIGHTLGLGVLDRKEKLCCRGLVAGTGDGRLALRLIDPLVPYEPREFYRQDVYLPLSYRVPPHQLKEEIAERWRQTRWAIEFASQEPGPGETAELRALREEILSRLERQKTLLPMAANISGGGVRLNMKERLRAGMLVELTFFLPQPQRVIEVVGEVVQVKGGPDDDCFNTAFHFRFIDEADRDRLIAHICAEQLRQLSQQVPWERGQAGKGERKSKPHPLRLAVALLILVLLLCYEARSIVASRERGEKHEIERVFETGIMELLRQRR